MRYVYVLKDDEGEVLYAFSTKARAEKAYSLLKRKGEIGSPLFVDKMLVDMKLPPNKKFYTFVISLSPYTGFAYSIDGEMEEAVLKIGKYNNELTITMKLPSLNVAYKLVEGWRNIINKNNLWGDAKGISEVIGMQVEVKHENM